MVERSLTDMLIAWVARHRSCAPLSLCSFAEDEIVCYYGGISVREGGRTICLANNSETSSAETYKFFSAAAYTLKHYCISTKKSTLSFQSVDRSFRHSAKETGSSVIFIHFYTRDSIEWR